jgi:3-hydroxyisobutyrate dehydrogenase
MSTKKLITVLGAGSTMGLPMARNLAGAGYEVRGWNRTRDKAGPLVQDGVEVFDSAAQAADGADVLLTMLSDADAVIDAVRHALPSVPEGTVWLQMSTIGEIGTERCAEIAGACGVTLFDAPVLGTKQPAEQGKLVILASGPGRRRSAGLRPADLRCPRSEDDVLGAVGDGTRLKLVANAWVLTVVEGGAETIALAEGLGLDPALLFEAIDGGALDLPYLRLKGKAISERNFEPSFRLTLAAKDARLIEESAQRRDIDVPLFSTIRRRLAEGAKDHGDEDMSATYWTSAPGSDHADNHGPSGARSASASASGDSTIFTSSATPVRSSSRCTCSLPRVSASRRPASPARCWALTRRWSPVESMNASPLRSRRIASASSR